MCLPLRRVRGGTRRSSESSKRDQTPPDVGGYTRIIGSKGNGLLDLLRGLYQLLHLQTKVMDESVCPGAGQSETPSFSETGPTALYVLSQSCPSASKVAQLSDFLLQG